MLILYTNYMKLTICGKTPTIFPDSNHIIATGGQLFQSILSAFGGNGDMSQKFPHIDNDERRSAPLIGKVVPNFDLVGDGRRPSYVGTDRTEV